jgi:beta-glucosidase/6-phospho-beta-glucosidase/beta-galactosidase
MIYMWFTGINYYKLTVEKDRDANFTTIVTAIWKLGVKKHNVKCNRTANMQIRPPQIMVMIMG